MDTFLAAVTFKVLSSPLRLGFFYFPHIFLSAAPKSSDKECILIEYLKEKILFVMDPYIQTYFLFGQLLFSSTMLTVLIHHFPSTWEDTPLVADSFSLQNVCKMSNFVMCALQTHKEADGNPPLLLYVLIRVWKSTMFNYWPDRMPSPPSCTTPLSLSLSSLPPFLPLPRSSPLVTLLVSSRKFSLQTDTGSSAAVYLCVYFAFGMHCCVWTLKFR